MKFLTLLIGCLATFARQPADAQQVLVEAEAFDNHGGWKLDTQFIDEMGSPYLLAHGLGKPVADASTKVTFPSTGQYRLFVRTKDWVARWKAEGSPGKFQVSVGGKPLAMDGHHPDFAVATKPHFALSSHEFTPLCTH